MARNLSEMTDEELREEGLSQEWRSGVAPADWPYYNRQGREVAPKISTDRTTEK